MFAICQEAGICSTSEELVRLVTGSCGAQDHAQYRLYLLPFGDKRRKSLPIEVAWRWCRAVARVSTILRLSILLEPGRSRLGVFRVDSGKRFMVQMCEPGWVVGSEPLVADGSSGGGSSGGSGEGEAL
jgi:hypothetical protein